MTHETYPSSIVVLLFLFLSRDRWARTLNSFSTIGSCILFQFESEFLVFWRPIIVEQLYGVKSTAELVFSASPWKEVLRFASLLRTSFSVLSTLIRFILHHFQTCFYLYNTIQSGDLTLTGSVPANSLLIYRPDKRIQIWRFILYMFLHAGWVVRLPMYRFVYFFKCWSPLWT